MKTEKTVKKMLEVVRAEEREKAAVLGKTNTNILLGGMAVITVMTAAFANMRTKKIQEDVRNSIADGIEVMRDDFTAAYGYTDSDDIPYEEEDKSSNQ